MKIISIIFAVYWAGIAIAAFAGMEFSPFTTGCASVCAAMGFLELATND